MIEPGRFLLEALDIIVRSGKARYIGVSNTSPIAWPVRWARRIFCGLGDSYPFSRATVCSFGRSSELLPLAQEEKLAVIPFDPLEGGLITGKYRHDEKPAQGRFSPETNNSAQCISKAIGMIANLKPSPSCKR